MWSLQKLLIIICIPLICVNGAANLIEVSGYEGKEVTVSCPYDEKYEYYEKYLCKNDCAYDDDVLIKTTEANKNRYSISDVKEEHIFTVTISGLHSMDAGKYWCGVTRSGRDSYPAQVKVEVVPEWCCVTSSELSSIVGHPVTMQCPYPPQHKGNRKFLCKGDHRNTCKDMVTIQSRFTLQDDVSLSSFSVMITELRAGDAGTYWCGSDSQWSPGNYTKIQLSVVFPQQSSTVTPTITEEPVGSQSTHILDKHINDVSPINTAVFIVPSVLLTLAFALVVVYKCKVRGPEANVNRNLSKTADAGEIMDEATIYENSRACSDISSSAHRVNAGEDQQESVYENFTMMN